MILLSLTNCFRSLISPFVFLQSPSKIFLHLATRKVLPALGTSDYSLINVKVDFKPKAFPGVPFHRTIFRYPNAVWDSFRCYTAESLSFFKNRVSRTDVLISEWIFSDIESFITEKYQHKLNCQPWFTPECAAVIAKRIHCYHRVVGLLLQSVLLAREFHKMQRGGMYSQYKPPLKTKDLAFHPCQTCEGSLQWTLPQIPH